MFNHFFKTLCLLLLSVFLFVSPFYFINDPLIFTTNVFWSCFFIYAFICMLLYRLYASKIDVGKWRYVFYIPFINIIFTVFLNELTLSFWDFDIIFTRRIFTGEESDIGLGFLGASLMFVHWIALFIGVVLGASKKESNHIGS